MTSAIELLPPELTDAIATYLTFGDLSRLMRTSRGLNQRLDCCLYQSGEARNKALWWACTNGLLSLIHRIVSTHGASPSTVTVPGSAEAARLPRPLTLHLAAKKDHLEAFKLLLELGARVDGENVQLDALLSELVTPPKPAFLRAFFAAGCASQVPPVLLDNALMLLVGHGAPLDIIELALDAGAKPNAANTRQCPLSTAARLNMKPVFDLLVARGASVQRTGPVNHPGHASLYVPVYAAAVSMVDQGTAMVETCLDLGADINHREPMRTARYPHRYYYGSPLLEYLSSIRTWPVKTGIDPVENLQYLFDKGAIGDGLPHVTLPTWSHRAPPYVDPLSTLEVLIDHIHAKLEQLADPQFLAVARLLMQHGAAARVGHLLARHDAPPRCSQQVKHAWRSFVALLLEHACAPGSDADASGRSREGGADATVLLSDLVHAGGGALKPLGDLTFETLAALVRSGADVNAPGPGGRPPPLLSLCWRYHLLEKMHDADDSYGAVHGREGEGPVAEGRRRLVGALLDAGADPEARLEGKTAEEWLLDGEEGYSDVGKRFVEGLVEEIRRKRGELLDGR